MKTFVVLFIIAVCLPAEARVRENIRQKVEVTGETGPIDGLTETAIKEVKIPAKKVKTPVGIAPRR